MNDYGLGVKGYNRQQILEREVKKFKEDLKGPLGHLVMTESEVHVFQNQAFKESLGLVEKVVLQSNNKLNFLTYNNQVSAVEDNKGKGGALKPSFMKRQKADDSEKELTGSLKGLFTFKFDQFEGNQVNVLHYNPYNQDLIAAGYGNPRIVDGRSSNGALALWTVKNCNIPLRIYESESPVLSLKFSKNSPNLLAAGTAKGSLHIFDIRRKSNQPIMTSDDLDELKHLESILEVDWICKSQGRDDYSESLVSISGDGKLLEWSMRKTLDVAELKQVVHTSNPHLKDPNELHSHNFRYSGGFSFDFHRKDPNIYLVATEDGAIHKCSKSYKEQYLESYYGHSGPIYKVRNSPFHPEVFLSCSADWSIRVWNSRSENPLFALKSLDLFDEVLDCRWNPYCSTSFISGCKDGRVEVWDLALKNLDPIFTLKADGKAKTVLEFSEKSPVVLIGNEAGELQCHRIFGYENQTTDEAKQRDALDKIIAINLKNNEEANGQRNQNGLQ
jgi:WD40 repeat protein